MGGGEGGQGVRRGWERGGDARAVLAGSFVPPGTSPAKDDRVSGSAESIIGVGGSDAVAALNEDPEAQGLGFYLLVIGLGVVLPSSAAA